MILQQIKCRDASFSKIKNLLVCHFAEYKYHSYSNWQGAVALDETDMSDSSESSNEGYAIRDNEPPGNGLGCVDLPCSSLRNDETESIFKASSFQHWFKDWQEERKHKLTASTFAGAIGFFPRRRVQLWLEKIGAREPFAGNVATCWSNIKEQEALCRYKLLTDNDIIFPRFQVYGKSNPDDNWLAASPDGVVDKLGYELPPRGILEIKCPLFNKDGNSTFPWKRIPLYYIPQAQGLMEIMDRDWMDFYVWTVNGSSLFRIYRDVEYWNALKVVLSDFWLKHVLPARELCHKYRIRDPLRQLPSLKPAPRHELCTYMVFESKRIADNSDRLFREIHGELQIG